jgi:hypothetical protein
MDRRDGRRVHGSRIPSEQGRSNPTHDPPLAGFRISGGEIMADTQLERRKMVSLPQEEFEEILERAAERGARHALHEVGLDGEDAAHDIRELRNLLDAFNEAKKTAGLTIIKMLVTGMVMALLAGAFVKLKLFGGQP